MHSPKPVLEIRPAKADTDQMLVARVQRGDKAAFDVLVRKYQHKIIKLVTRYVHDSSEALDVAQEAFIKAYRAIPGFRGDSAFYTWLYRIAINTAKNYLVAEGRRPLDHGVDLQDPDQYEMQARLKDMDTPERLLLTEEIQRTVEAAIGELPED
ncbi:MAG: sigma-70 family RNA polymerase sigma factor, partial [Gammaproteobacteria bacterium]